MNTRDDLPGLLDLQEDGEGVWLAPTPTGFERRRHLFGGLVAAQALRAGHLSAGTDRVPHSMHAYFLLAGRFGEPLRCAVDPSRDGRSFAARRIEVHQSEGVILTMLASFQHPEAGNDYHVSTAAVGAPAPGTPSTGTGTETGTGDDAGPFERVRVEGGPRQEGSLDWSHTRYWCRTRDRLPDDPGLHAAALVAMGDLETVYPPLAAMGATVDNRTVASLDYAVWFHRAARADQWLLYDLRPAGSGGGRGLVYGVVHDAAGGHVASLGMELLLREHRAPPEAVR